jgi:hypothetical protein
MPLRPALQIGFPFGLGLPIVDLLHQNPVAQVLKKDIGSVRQVSSDVLAVLLKKSLRRPQRALLIGVLSLYMPK